MRKADLIVVATTTAYRFGSWGTQLDLRVQQQLEGPDPHAAVSVPMLGAPPS